MIDPGDNERTVMLAEFAKEAIAGAKRVEAGEEHSISGWLAFGHNLNGARRLFPWDREFGQWIEANVLYQLGTVEIRREDRIAAMWAAENPVDFEAARQNGNPRTIRGIHAKWKEMESQREADEFAKKQHKIEEQRSALAQSPDETAPTPASFQSGTQEDDTTSNDIPEQPPQDEPNPYAKLRAAFQKLTPEAQEDEWLGLRLDLADEKAARKKAEDATKAIKAELADLTADDKNEVIRKLQADVKNAANAKWKALEDRDAYHKQVYALKKRLEETEKRLAEINKIGVSY